MKHYSNAPLGVMVGLRLLLHSELHQGKLHVSFHLHTVHTIKISEAVVVGVDFLIVVRDVVLCKISDDFHL